MNLDPKFFNPKTIRNKISSAKNELMTPEELDKFTNNEIDEVTVKVYTEYQKKLKVNNELIIDVQENEVKIALLEDKKLASEIRNVDLIVGGHSHTLLHKKQIVKDAEGNDIVIVQNWKWGLNAGHLDVQF